MKKLKNIVGDVSVELKRDKEPEAAQEVGDDESYDDESEYSVDVHKCILGIYLFFSI